MLRSQRGMTLIEIVIVMTIIVSLMAIVANIVSKQQQKGKVKQSQIAMGVISQALELYQNDCGHYPESLDSLEKADNTCPNWGPEAYVKKLPKDGWNREFSYHLEGSKYTIISLGADGKEGGDGYDKDLSSED